MFFEDLEKHGSNIAAIESCNRVTTYKNLDNLCEEFAIKIPTRSLIFLDIGNDRESLVAYLSCLRKKAVAFLIDQDTNLNLIQQNIEHYKPQYIFSQKNFSYIVVAQYGEYTLYSTQNHINIMNKDLGLLLSTSGSTGSPKLVCLSYKNLQANAVAISKYLPIVSNDRVITTLPMSYSYGLSIINTHLLLGATLILNKYSLFSKEFWDYFQAQKPTTFGGVPYTYKMLQRLGLAKMEMSSIRYLTQAGGKLDETTLNYLLECPSIQNKPFYCMYGQTEATARMSYLMLEELKQRPSSIGKAIPGGSFYLEDENGSKVIMSDSIGEIIYSGANVMLCYACNIEDLNSENKQNDILATGDIGYFDKDEFFYISGRKKRFIKLSGKRISLDEVELIINKNNLELICTGDDEYLMIGGTNIVNHISLIKNILLKEFGIIHSIVKFYQISQIIYTSSGKISYSETFIKAERI